MTTGVDYAWARVAARQSRRPDANAWHRIETARTLEALLDAARGPAFDPWLAGLDAQVGTHAIEAHLRARWRDAVREVAGWMPTAWQPAIVWWTWLPDLPVLEALARGRAVPPAAVDPAYLAFAAGPPPRTSPWGPLAAAWREGGDVHRAWGDEWRRRLPQRRNVALALLVRAVRAHLAAFRAGEPGSGVPLRASLAASLRLLFRKATAEPACVFVFLAQWLLDGERLRGELVRRSALPRVPLAT